MWFQSGTEKFRETTTMLKMIELLSVKNVESLFNFLYKRYFHLLFLLKCESTSDIAVYGSYVSLGNCINLNCISELNALCVSLLLNHCLLYFNNSDICLLVEMKNTVNLHVINLISRRSIWLIHGIESINTGNKLLFNSIDVSKCIHKINDVILNCSISHRASDLLNVYITFITLQSMTFTWSIIPTTHLRHHYDSALHEWKIDLSMVELLSLNWA